MKHEETGLEHVNRMSAEILMLRFSLGDKLRLRKTVDEGKIFAASQLN